MSISEKIEKHSHLLHKTLMILAACFLFSTLNDQSLWLDEVATVSLSGPDDVKPGFIEAFRDAQMPLVYFFVFLSRLFFGHTEFAARLPVALSALGLLALLPGFFKKSGFSPILGILAGVFLLFHPQFIFYSQDSRAYMPWIFTLFLWAYWRDQPSLKASASCWGALMTHTFSIVTVGFTLMIDGVDSIFLKKNSIKKFLSEQKYNLLALIAFLPIYVFFYFQIRSSRIHSSENLDLIERTQHAWALVLNAWNFLFDFRIGIWILVTGLSVVFTFQKNTLSRFLMASGLSLFTQAMMISLSQHFFFPRYLLLMLPMIITGALLVPKKLTYPATLIAICLFLGVYLSPSLSFQVRPWPGFFAQLFPSTAHALQDYQRENWKDLARTMDWMAQPGDTIGFLNCTKCSKYPLMLYGAHSAWSESLNWVDTQDRCPKWIVSTLSTSPDVAQCRSIDRIGHFSSIFLFRGYEK